MVSDPVGGDGGGGGYLKVQANSNFMQNFRH